MMMAGLDRAMCLLAAALLCIALAACGALPARIGGAEELRTTSDQSDTERRARVRLELASAYFSQGQLEVALDELKQALVIFPSLAEGFNLRGLIYAGLGQERLAEESFQRALSLAPQDGAILHNQAWFLCQQARYPEAERSFAAALAQPGYREPSKTLLAQGVCQARAGQRDRAIATLNSAYERDPGNPALAVNLAEQYRSIGQFERAAFYIRRVNQQPALATAQTLWLGARIERRLGREDPLRELLQQLRARYPNSPEALAAERGAFDD